MNSTLEIPVWLAILIGALALVATLQYFLLPPMRMLMRRRANRVIDEVNSRLALTLPSFKLTKREVLIDRLVYHPDILQEVENQALEKNLPRDAVMQQVRGYAREIVPAFNAWLYFKWAYWLARRIVHLLYRVRLGFADDAALAKLDANSSVVFVMNHRSNMDYILATYLAAEKTALSYAVGEWARVWPLQQLIRSMGGYFVRRDSGDPVYRKVLQCYVQMAAEGGVPQAVFPEGKLSRDGKLGAAKLGLLGYLTRHRLGASNPSTKTTNPATPKTLDDRTSANHPLLTAESAAKTATVLAAGKPNHDIIFIPVGINYDRILEDRTLLRLLDRSKARRGTFFTLRKFSGFIGHNIWLAITGRWYRFGYACVNFGTPLSLKQWQQEMQTAGTANPDKPAEFHAGVEALADELINRIGKIIPILPVALVATIFSEENRVELSEIDIKIQVSELIERLRASGAHVYIPRGNLDYAVTVGLRMLTLRHMLNESDGVYSNNNDERELLEFYAASIAHLVKAT